MKVAERRRGFVVLVGGFGMSIIRVMSFMLIFQRGDVILDIFLP